MFDAAFLLPAEQRARRLRELLAVSAAALGASMLFRMASNGPGITTLAMASTLAVLGLARLLLARGRVDASAALMMGALTAMLSFLMVRGQGLRDVALLGFPLILMFTALLATPRMFVVLLTCFLLVCVGVGLAAATGWHAAAPRPFRMAELLDVCLMLLVSAFGVRRMASELGSALHRLAEENRAVRESQRRIEYLATRDALTGLPNRAALRERFEQAVAQAVAPGRRLALLYVDLDQFKAVNDSRGHPAGDELLRCMAQRLAPLLATGDTLSRPGGDEFLVLLGDVGDDDRPAMLARAIQAAAAEPLVLQGVELHVSSSIGVALYPTDGADFDSLLKQADIAMYRAKDAGRNAVRFYDPQMNAHVAEHLQLIAGLRRALAQGEFELHYQPQIDLASGRVVGAEALLRWRHPERGLVPPALFIPVAEHSGQIVEIGAWVLRQACAQAAAWQREGLDGLVVSVNMSPVQLRRGDFERAVDDALNASGLPPRLLELELTETMLAQETDSMQALFKRLRERGIAFAIDDFGTGYSNLAYLKRFEVERLKIDQSFIRRLTVNAEDEAIVSAILRMAQALQLGVIAEGVEDADTLARLRALGCAQGQGYHWAPALPPAQFAAFVHARHAEPAAA